MRYGGKLFYLAGENYVFKKFVSYLDYDLNNIEAIKLLKNSLKEKSLQAEIGKMVNILGLKY